MSQVVTSNDKTTTLFKKYIQGKVNTYSGTDASAEYPKNALPLVYNKNVAIQTIPTVVPLSSDLTLDTTAMLYSRYVSNTYSYICKYEGVSLSLLPYNRGYNFYYNGATNLLTGVILPNAATSGSNFYEYTVKEYISNTWVTISPDKYIFDRDAGVITFYDGVDRSNSQIKADFWRYEGKTLDTANLDSFASGSVNGLTVSGALSAGSLSTGTIVGTSLDVGTGTVKSGNITSGDVTCTSFIVGGIISTNGMTSSGAIRGSSLNLGDGAIASGDITSSGAITISGTTNGTALSIKNGDITNASIDAIGNIKGTSFNIGTGTITSGNVVSSGTLTSNTLLTRSEETYDSSAEGVNIIVYKTDAAYQLRFSNDSGATFTISDPSVKCTSAGISANGKYQIMTGRPLGSSSADYLYTCTNYTNWRNVSTSYGFLGNFVACAISQNGRYQIAGCNIDYLYMSSNYGSTWAPLISSGGKNSIMSIAMSASGRYIIVADYTVNPLNNYTPAISISSNYGNSWKTPSSITLNSVTSYPAYKIAMSTSGRYCWFIDSNNGNKISVSSDYCDTWNAYEISYTGTTITTNFTSISTSSNGKYVAVISNGIIYYNTSYGSATTSWYKVTINGISFNDIKISGSGKIQYAITSSGVLYISTSYGVDGSWSIKSNTGISDGTKGLTISNGFGSLVDTNNLQSYAVYNDLDSDTISTTNLSVQTLSIMKNLSITSDIINIGSANQGDYSIAIGINAKCTNNSICLNATGNSFTSVSTPSGFYVKPIAYETSRVTTPDGTLSYNTSSGEIVYSKTTDPSMYYDSSKSYTLYITTLGGIFTGGGTYPTLKYGFAGGSSTIPTPVATSADNNYQLCGYTFDYGAGILTKSPSSQYWTVGVLTSTQNSIQYVVISFNGQYQAYTTKPTGSSIYNLAYSTDFGASWGFLYYGTSTTPTAIAMSGNGKYILSASVTTGTSPVKKTYMSSDYRGLSGFAEITQLNSYTPIKYAISFSGKYMAMISDDSAGGFLFISSDYGVSWICNNTNSAINGVPSTEQELVSVEISRSGRYQIATTTNGKIYSSIDYGSTWTVKDSISDNGTNSLNYIAISVDARYQYVAGLGNVYIYWSTDYGTTWNKYYPNKYTVRGLTIADYFTGIIERGPTLDQYTSGSMLCNTLNISNKLTLGGYDVGSRMPKAFGSVSLNTKNNADGADDEIPSWSVNNGFNVSNITYNGRGRFTVNFVRSFPSANYSVVMSCSKPYTNTGGDDANVTMSLGYDDGTRLPTASGFGVTVVSTNVGWFNPRYFNFVVFYNDNGNTLI